MNSEGICPVCGEEYYEVEEYDLSGKEQVKNLASNTLFGECAKITRGPHSDLGWRGKLFQHTTDQTFAAKSGSLWRKE